MPDAQSIANNLYEAIASTFNLEELKSLCFDLDVNDQNLPGETLLGKARELVQYLERYNRLPELLPRLKKLRPHMAWDSYQPAEPEALSPFKGLHYFDEGDAHLFFGREKLTAELVDHLRQHRFLAVVGASGSGKSSLVRAGVVPTVRSGAIEGLGGSSARWPIHVITPGDEPLKALAASLTRESESVTATATLWDDLRHNNQSLDLFLYRQMSDQSEGRLLLVVDQFEELFTQCDDAEERRLLVENLVQAVQSGKQGRLSLILTLRADFYAYAVQYEGLRPLLETRQKIVGAMNPDELRQAIEAPAEQGNWQFQPGLVETILQDVGREPGALPLLSHALQETWTRREGRVMTLAGYQAAGGVRRAIAQTADSVYVSLTLEQQTIARNIFLRLTELGEGTEDTRRRVSLTELVPQDDIAEQVRVVLDLLTRKRLVILNEERAKEGDAQNYAEVAHEALIREWPTLRGWLDENREGLRLHRQLTEMAEAWDAAAEDPSYLYRGGRLAQAQEWANQDLAVLNDLEHRFLMTSQQTIKQEEAEREARRERELEIARQQVERANTIRRATWGLLVLFVIAVGAAFIAFAQREIAQDNLATATIAQGEAQINLAEAIDQARIAQSQALAASSQTVAEQDPMEALLLAIAAGQTTETPLAMDALNEQLPVMAKPLMTLSYEGPVNGAVWNEAKSQILSWGCAKTNEFGLCIQGTAKVWDATSGSLILTLSQESWVYGAVWNEAGSQILSWGCTETGETGSCIQGNAKVWDATSGNLLLTLRHEGSVNGAVWNEAGSQILSWSGDDTARVWDTSSGDLLLTLRHEGLVSGAVWNEVESQILSWSGDGTAQVWDASSGDLLLTLSHEGWVRGAVWNEAESQILSWSDDGTARLWDASSGNLLLVLRHESWVFGAVWNEAESQILSWSEDDTARVWDANSGNLLLVLRHEGRVYGAVWNEAESQILSWSGDGTAQVWDASSGDLFLTLSHEGWVRGAVWNEAESQILSWSNDGTAQAWDASSGNLLLTLPHEGVIYGVVWNEAESQILSWSEDGTARVWDVSSGNLVLTLSNEGAVNGAVWNEAESQILSWGREGTVRVWDASSGDLLLTLSNEGAVNGAVWSEAESQILSWNDDGTAQVWDASSGNLLLTLSHEDWINGAVWNEAKSQILSWGCTETGEIGPCIQGTAQVWDASSGNLLLTLSHESTVTGAVWNEAESQILSWGGDGTARVWDVSSGDPLLTLRHESWINGAVWNEAESQILSWSDDSTARVWDASSGDLLLTLSHAGWVTGAVWNEAESQILSWSHDGTARVWDASSGDLLLTLSHEDSVSGVVWNEAESQILSWSFDGNVRVWDATSGELLFTLGGDGNSVTVARWNQDESRILLATQNGFIRVYYTHTAELAEQACQYATRNFTWQEWQLYFPGQLYEQTCPDLPVHPSVPENARP